MLFRINFNNGNVIDTSNIAELHNALTNCLINNDTDIASIETIDNNRLCVCRSCLMAISSREKVRYSPIDSIYNESTHCDWCLDDGFDELFEIL